MWAAAAASGITATRTKAIRLIRCLLYIRGDLPSFVLLFRPAALTALLIQHLVITTNHRERALTDICSDLLNHILRHRGRQMSISQSAARDRADIRTRPDEAVHFGCDDTRRLFVEAETFLGGLGHFYRLFEYRGWRVGDRRYERLGLLVFVLTKVNDHTRSVFGALFTALAGLVPPKIGMAYDQPDLRLELAHPALLLFLISPFNLPRPLLATTPSKSIPHTLDQPQTLHPPL